MRSRFPDSEVKMKMDLIACLIALAPALGVCQDGFDGTDLIDNTKEKPDLAISEPAPAISKKDAAEIRAEIGCLGQYLDAFYKDCSRYPTSREGLLALNSKPKSIVCKNWGLKTANGSKPYVASLPKNVSGLEYVSTNGLSYKLKWVGFESKPGKGNTNVSAEDFLKTCPGFKEN